MKIETKFDYLDYVEIIGPRLKGRVVKIEVASTIFYKVEYWLNEEIKIAYVYEGEIELWDNNSKRIGLTP